MKFYLISDNVDTYIGMRMAGIEGSVVHEAAEVREAFAKAQKDPEVAVVLLTAKLMSLCREEIYEHKLNGGRPLVVEIADRHGDGSASDAIERYIREAVGIKI